MVGKVEVIEKAPVAEFAPEVKVDGLTRKILTLRPLPLVELFVAVAEIAPFTQLPRLFTVPVTAQAAVIVPPVSGDTLPKFNAVV